MNKGDYVRFKNDDATHPSESGIVSHVDTREGKQYLGIAIDLPYRVGHIVWRYWDQVVVATAKELET